MTTAAGHAASRVVVYSAAEQQYCQGLLDGFRIRHPAIEVDFVFGISVALLERYLAELAAERPAADVLWSSAMALQMELALSGHALPHRSPQAATLPHGALYRDLACATTVEQTTQRINTTADEIIIRMLFFAILFHFVFYFHIVCSIRQSNGNSLVLWSTLINQHSYIVKYTFLISG